MTVAQLDTDLMLRFRQGETVCLGALLERHRAPVVHFLYRMVQNRAIAEELAQDVFLRVYRSHASYEPTAKFTNWLYRIATNVALNWVRDRRHERHQESLDEVPASGQRRQIADDTPTAADFLLQQVKLGEVRTAIASLPERQRTVVILHKYHEMEYTQIAEVLKCSPQAVKALLFRAYETLRARLAHMAPKSVEV